MKQNINEIKRMQKLAGILTENKTSKYVTIINDDGEEYPELNKEAIRQYLKSVINPEYIDDVDTFMNDDEGYGESSMYYFDIDDKVDSLIVYDDEVEEWVEREMSYYLFSKPDEFPHK